MIIAQNLERNKEISQMLSDAKKIVDKSRLNEAEGTRQSTMGTRRDLSLQQSKKKAG